jgi:ATP-dependent DNA helicase RecG
LRCGKKKNVTSEASYAITDASASFVACAHCGSDFVIRHSDFCPLLMPARVTLDTSLAEMPSLPAATQRMLAKEGITMAREVLMHLPFRHEDRRRVEFKGFARSDTPVCHHVRIVSTRVLRFGRRGGVFEAVVEGAADNPMHQQLTLRWFGMTFMQKVFAVDMELVVYGKIKDAKNRLVMDHPDYEIVLGDDADADMPNVHTGRIVPVYRLRGGLKQKALRAAAWRVVEALDVTSVPDLLPAPKTEGEFAGLSRGKALRDLHFPNEQADLDQSRRYLALEEFYVMQMRVVRRRLHFKQAGGLVQKPSGRLAEDFVKSLPFSFTEAQRRCLEEIRADMASPQRMNRLLHGDVGSGKTVVALAAMLVAVESGHQAALMAPTQILAEQHYANAQRWLEPLGIRVALRTGDRKEDRDEPLFQQGAGTAATGKPQVFVGTHALLYEDDSVSKLGLVVVDEQHKFGVAQRARLIARGHTPDVLVMTATPIPRTLTLTVYGDLDVSVIDQRPKERGTITTAVRDVTKLKDVVKFLREKLEEGRQCYVVYPLIEESEKLDASAAKTGFAEWTKHLAPHTVGLLHGRMDSLMKETVMRQFRAGQIKALVSTTVIEVGVDVPNATVMIIHDAARFGLAQLHQLRGRIGRGAHTSWCVLFVAKGDTEAQARLRVMEETSDGFVIAEEDLRRRGPGDVLGDAQSGEAPLLFGELLADTRLVTLARRLAERTLSEDPELTQPRHAMLQELVRAGEDLAVVGRNQ